MTTYVPPRKPSLRLVAYLRVSEVGGREGSRFISPKMQRESCEGYAALYGHRIIDVIEDLDESGGKADRPGFQRALAMVEGGEADGVIVAKLDRFARSLVVALTAIERIDKAGGQLISVADNFDTTTPMGKAMSRIALVFAELERDRIRDAWDAARRDAIHERGIHVAPTAAGYTRGADGVLVPDPVAAPVIHETFLRRGAGASWSDLAEFLDERLPRPEGRHWTRQTVSSLVGRRVFLGEAYSGDIVNRKAHLPIVTHAEWEAAQAAVRCPTPRNGSALLAGILRCAGCGYTMTRASDGARGYSNYVCRRRHAGGICPEPSRVSVGRADPFVEQAFLEWVAQQEPIVFVGTPRTDDLDNLVARVEAAEAELVAYRDANLVSVIGREAYVSGLEERQHLLDEARRALADVQRSRTVSARRFETLELWPTLPISAKRRLLASVIDAVFCRRSASHSRHEPIGDRLRVLWHDEAPVDLPDRKHPALRPFAFN
jgi:site-specific DNA recombinase